jgi:hypothetical protein
MSYEFISNSYDADMTTTQNYNANNSQNKPQLSSQNSSNKQQNNENLFTKITNIFNTKTGTILATSIGMTIGFSFKDLISSIVSDLLQPIFVILVSYLPYFKNNVIFSKYESSINLNSLFSNIFTFILIIISVYYVNQGIQQIQ